MYSTEILKLVEMLDKAGIPYFVQEIFNGWQVCYPQKDNPISDAICHQYSYGSEQGLLEIMGLCESEDDDVEGYLTAEEVFDRWSKHYFANI